MGKSAKRRITCGACVPRSLLDLARKEAGRTPRELEAEAAELLGQLARSRVAATHLLMGHFGLRPEHHGRGVELSVLRPLAVLDRLAELGRQQLHRAERNRAAQQLKASIDDDNLAPEVERLVAAGEPVKVIQDKLRISKARVVRLKKLAVADAAYRARFAPK